MTVLSLTHSQQQAEKHSQKANGSEKSCPREHKLTTICQLTLSAWASGRGQTGTLDTPRHADTQPSGVCGAQCANTSAHGTIKTLIEGGSCCLIQPESCSDSTPLLVPPYFTSGPENHTEYTTTERVKPAAYLMINYPRATALTYLCSLHWPEAARPIDDSLWGRPVWATSK